MNKPDQSDDRRQINFLREVIYHLALMPRRVLVSLGISGLSLSIMLILTGLLLYQPPSLSAQRVAPGEGNPAAPAPPADFTPVATAPPAFADQTTHPTTTVPTEPDTTEEVTEAVATAPAVPSPIAEQLVNSDLAERQLISILVLGLDSRKGEDGPSRTDAMMVAVVDPSAPSLTVISIPRDLWVSIPGYQPGRINTAYFMGELYGRGIQVASRTVSQVLGIPIHHTVVLDFEGFRKIVDLAGGIKVDVPEAINDPFFPDADYGTTHLVIPAGPQQMDGNLALKYARTRHGSSDIVRAERQQAILEALWEKLLTPAQLPKLPLYLKEGLSHVETSLSISDLFFLARTGSELERDQIYNHVLRAPLLWNGVTADGQYVLLYDSWSLQQAVQQWLAEARQS